MTADPDQIERAYNLVVGIQDAERRAKSEREWFPAAQEKVRRAAEDAWRRGLWRGT